MLTVLFPQISGLPHLSITADLCDMYRLFVSDIVQLFGCIMQNMV